MMLLRASEGIPFSQRCDNHTRLRTLRHFQWLSQIVLHPKPQTLNFALNPQSMRPANMPLKSFEEGSNQQILTQALSVKLQVVI